MNNEELEIQLYFMYVISMGVLFQVASFLKTIKTAFEIIRNLVSDQLQVTLAIISITEV